MKTLAIILHYNTPQYTDALFEILEPEQKSGNYDLIVLDNGSDEGKKSKYNSHTLDTNVYFGGGLNAAMDWMMAVPDYDSLLFLNSDLIVGNNFVKALRGDAFLNGWDVSSPCIIQPEKTQNHWKQMLPWGSSRGREVRWIDLQCPLISRRFVQHIHDTKTTENYIDPLLIRGWGIDMWLGIICETQGWRTGVCDHVPAVHLGSMTMKSLNNVSEYCQLAEKGMYEFFQKNLLMKEFGEMKNWGEQYKYE
jgi:hypothetical protein